MILATESPACAGHTRKLTRPAPSYIEHNDRANPPLTNPASRKRDAEPMSRDWLRARITQGQLLNDLVVEMGVERPEDILGRHMRTFHTAIFTGSSK